MRGIRLCPSHCSRLSHCPKSPRRTTQKAHAWHISFPYVGSRRYTRMVHIRQLTAGYNIPTVSIHRCLAFLTIFVICEITSSQRQASDKRSFHKVASTHINPITGFLQVRCLAKIIQLFELFIIMRHRNHKI